MEAKYPGRSKDVISIINASAEKAKERIDAQLKISDEANFVILATPATIKSMAYPNQLAKLYNRDLKSEPPKFIQNERWYKQKGSKISLFLLYVKNYKSYPSLRPVLEKYQRV